ncbi:MAG: transporter [Pseudomonadales bacterium]|nr:transporter [Pseudomonadales bacterium]
MTPTGRTPGLRSLGLCASLLCCLAHVCIAQADTPSDTLIADLEARIVALEARIAALEATRPDSATVANSARADTGTTEVAALLADPREQERLIRGAFQRQLLERGGLLLPPGALDIDLSLRHLNTSSDRIVIDGFTILPILIVGDIVSERVRHAFTEVSATARLGLPWDMQASVRVPAAYQERRIVQAESRETAAYDFGLGDIELELSRQVLRGKGAWPDLLASLHWKLDTGSNPLDAAPGELTLGSGHQSVGASLTAVTVADPAAFFGGLSYTHNLATGSDIGRYRPGDSYGFNLGLALALNLGSSLSFAYDHRFTEAARLDGATIQGSRATTGILSIGASYSSLRARTFDFSIGVGVTEDAPDLLITTSLPLRVGN